MLRTITVFLLLLIGGVANAQDSNSETVIGRDIEAATNRALAMIYIAEDESTIGSDLELTVDQGIAIQEMADVYSDMLDEVAKLPPEIRADPKTMVKHATRLILLEKTLTEKVLLPHQVQPLLGKLFTKFVEASNGDALKAIQDYYPDKIQIDAKREKELAKISKSTKDAIAKAKKKFEAELREIHSKAGDDVRALLTDGEKQILGTR